MNAIWSLFGKNSPQITQINTENLNLNCYLELFLFRVQSGKYYYYFYTKDYYHRS